jgi:hypothetical protein
VYSPPLFILFATAYGPGFSIWANDIYVEKVFRISKTCYSFSETFLAEAVSCEVRKFSKKNVVDVNMPIPVNVSMTALCYRSKKDHGRCMAWKPQNESKVNA